MNKYISFAAAAVLSAAVLAACGTKKEPPHPVTITPVQTADTAQTIDTPETIDTPDTVKKKFSLETTELTLEEGQSEKIKYADLPKGAAIKWKSSDDEIAAVDKNGQVTALKNGKCVITADVNGTTDKAYITVKKPKPADIHLTMMTIMVEGHSLPIEITQSDKTIDPSEVEVTFSDPDILDIDSSGNITAKKTGICTITAVLGSDKRVKDSVTMTVINDISRESSSNANTQIDSDNDVQGGQTSPQNNENTDDNENENNEDYQDNADEQEDNPEDEPIYSDVVENIGGVYYVDGILVVNKTYPLPDGYNPGGLTSQCRDAFEELRAGAREDGIDIYISSGFRSYETQRQLYNSYVNTYGRQSADTFSARAGYSEHQTGLAIDCNIVNSSFAGTKEAIWLEEHCHEYGFIIRYPQGKEWATGYIYEPWHIRYVGDNAAAIAESGLSLEEYYGFTSQYR
ncbi:MAG: D-alanyl-D-alanine carboxypeptidase family protein [Clostridia bacterium]|nr:D-alanyl-D-alanine carboxypeptidase family protein [Clostridia bacterium]